MKRVRKEQKEEKERQDNSGCTMPNDVKEMLGLPSKVRQGAEGCSPGVQRKERGLKSGGLTPRRLEKFEQHFKRRAKIRMSAQRLQVRSPDMKYPHGVFQLSHLPRLPPPLKCTDAKPAEKCSTSPRLWQLIVRLTPRVLTHQDEASMRRTLQEDFRT